MGTNQPIKDRRETDVRPIVERREPAWIRRMREQGLPNKDLTAQVKAA